MVSALWQVVFIHQQAMTKLDFFEMFLLKLKKIVLVGVVNKYNLKSDWC
jgi:hypothetical protein